MDNNNNMRMGDKYIWVFSILAVENRWLKYVLYTWCNNL
jgi:hypothetical protein